MDHPPTLATAPPTTETPAPASLAILRELLAFPTVSRDSNLALIDWVAAYLRRHGVSSQLSFDASGTKANLFATLGHGTTDGIVISGHTDVVPVDGQAWHSDPFSASTRDGRVYGRGACDMKGFIAAALACVPALLGAARTRPIHLAFTYDEEVGCRGVRTLLADMDARHVRPAACVIGEPTEMRVVRAHKGSRNYRCCVRGREAHASRTMDGVNAIEHAARLVAHLADMADDFARQPDPGSDFETPFDTLQTSLMQGGMARNIVPRDCEFTFGYRYLPTSDADGIFAEVERFARETVLPRMHARDPRTGVDFTLLSDNPALEPQRNATLARLAVSLDGVRGPGAGVGYMTEGGLYQRAGIPTIICGPGSIAQAHQPDEFVEIAQLVACERFLTALGQAAAHSSSSSSSLFGASVAPPLP